MKPARSIPLISRVKAFLFNRALNRFRSTNLNKLPENHFASIKSVGILFDASEPKSRDAVLAYAEDLKRSGMTAKLLGYFNAKVNGIDFSFDFIDVNNLSFAYIPQGTSIENFISTQFDLLINLDTTVHKPLSYIAAASKALFKIGPAQGNHAHYDLMVSIRGSDMDNYLQQIQATFNKIRG